MTTEPQLMKHLLECVSADLWRLRLQRHTVGRELYNSRLFLHPQQSTHYYYIYIYYKCNSIFFNLENTNRCYLKMKTDDSE